MRKSIHLISDLPNLMYDSFIIGERCTFTSTNWNVCPLLAAHMMLRAARRPRNKAASITAHAVHEHEDQATIAVFSSD